MNRREKTGFTLAELLIVVTIIAILVAIAIPIFNRLLERSREAYDIYTMRQAASAAQNVYYKGVYDKMSAEKAGFKWWDVNGDNKDNDNASGVYVPGNGTFQPKSSKDKSLKPYGKGTALNGGTVYTLGNTRGAYSAKEDYTKAAVLVSIFPYGEQPHIDVYWKEVGGGGTFVGGKNGNNGDEAKYSIRIYIN